MGWPRCHCWVLMTSSFLRQQPRWSSLKQGSTRGRSHYHWWCHWISERRGSHNVSTTFPWWIYLTQSPKVMAVPWEYDNAWSCSHGPVRGHWYGTNAAMGKGGWPNLFKCVQGGIYWLRLLEDKPYLIHSTLNWNWDMDCELLRFTCLNTFILIAVSKPLLTLVGNHQRW